MANTIDVRVHHKAGVLRSILRTCMSSLRGLLPKEPALKRVNIRNLKVLCWINDGIDSHLYLARSYEPEDISAIKKPVRCGIGAGKTPVS